MGKMFFAREDRKVTEKYLHRVLATSICGILLCMCCFVSTTWAWYNLSISNEGNVIQVGVFDVSITVKHAEGEMNSVSPQEDGTYHLPAGKYTVTISGTEKNTVSGYCDVKLGGNPVGVAEIQSGEDAFTFTVEIPQPQSQDGTEQHTVLEIRPIWGNVTVEEGMRIANEESAEKDTAAPEQSDDMDNTGEEEKSEEEGSGEESSGEEGFEEEKTESKDTDLQVPDSQLPDSQLPVESAPGTDSGTPAGTDSAAVESSSAADSGQGEESVPTESSSETTGEQGTPGEG